MVARAGLRRVRRHARLHHHPRAARVRLRQDPATNSTPPFDACAGVTTSCTPSARSAIGSRAPALRPVQRARVRHGEHRVHRSCWVTSSARPSVRTSARSRTDTATGGSSSSTAPPTGPPASSLASSNLVILPCIAASASGVAYSLLFSSFESWAITEADRLRLDRRYLVGLFSTATFFNACSAVAGIVGNLVVDFSRAGRSGPPRSGIGTRTDVGEGWRRRGRRGRRGHARRGLRERKLERRRRRSIASRARGAVPLRRARVRARVRADGAGGAFPVRAWSV